MLLVHYLAHCVLFDFIVNISKCKLTNFIQDLNLFRFELEPLNLSNFVVSFNLCLGTIIGLNER